MKEIFYNDRSLVFIRKDQEMNIEHDIVYEYEDMFKLRKKFDEFIQDSSIKKLYIKSSYKPSELFDDFIHGFPLIKAGGGLVRNSQKEYLLIYRLGKWDLPKGKKESGETIAQTAEREVKEETTLPSLQIVSKLPSTFHLVEKKKSGEFLVKKCFWYSMSTTDTKISPQTEEGIEQAIWCTWGEVLQKAPFMYSSITSLVYKIEYGGVDNFF